jgi:S1-C subfamily serine protease
MSSGRGRLGWARRVVGATALTATVGLVSLPALAVTSGPAATSSAVLADWNTANGRGQGQLPWGYSGNGQSQPQTQGSAVDSAPATDAESTGVVLIDTQLSYEGAAGAGTGIVLTSGGEVLTNYHVVEGATAINVTVATTGRTYTADVVGHSATSDVALLQLQNASGLTTATVDNDTVALGDSVTAVGNAGGTGTLTAAKGSVTDLSSAITTASEGSVASERLRGLIETDADVVAGDSGGPLLDAQGEVVGIDTAASSGTSSSTIDGYAIPIDDALTVVQQIRSGGETSTVQIGANAFLGVQVTDTASTYPGAAYGSTGTGGATVAGVVDGSPAAQAGLVAGDTITAVGSTPVSSAAALSGALTTHAVGDQVRVTWTDSAGATQQATVTLAASPTA